MGTGLIGGIRNLYKLRLKRQGLLWRSFRSRHSLSNLVDRTRQIGVGDVLAVLTLRNEALRLPFFLQHYRRLGVAHFLCVDNGSDDGTQDLLTAEPDVSLWQTEASYRASRFGVDWQTWLLMHYGHGHWCLTLDADEILIYPFWESRDLHALTARLEATGQPALGALMLDMYPEGPVGATQYAAGEDPFEPLAWFDNGPWRVQRQAPAQNLWLQGGVRERVFFAERPERSPTLNKLPLVKWNRRFAYTNSTHAILPPRLNLAYSGPGHDELSGVLLHSKFLNTAVTRAQEEKRRGQHFARPEEFSGYYDHLSASPTLRNAHSLRYEDWQQLERLGLMSRGGWK